MHTSVHQAFGMESFQADLLLHTTKVHYIGEICDWTAKLYRTCTYLRIKICLVFEFQFAESFKVILVKSLYCASKSLDF